LLLPQVDPSGSLQPPFPSQRRGLEQLSSLLLRGSGAQAPRLLHFWQLPQEPTLQHTPSRQFPVAHSEPEEQPVPAVFFFTQLPPLQMKPETQSPSPPQPPGHPPPLQRRGAQDWDEAAAQAPRPSHRRAGTAASPLQVAAAQMVAPGCLRQAPRPSHIPSSPHPEAGVSSQLLCGSVPSLMGRHLPAAPPVAAAEQDRHRPLQASSQQVPSTQNPEEHSAVWVQPPPLAFLAVQAPDRQ
jgi:hypothetical protein